MQRNILAVLVLMVIVLFGTSSATPIVYFDTADTNVHAGDTIQITIFSAVGTDHIRMDRISDDGDGTASNLWINPNYNAPLDAGALINLNNVLVEDVSSKILPYCPGVIGTLYSFDYTIFSEAVVGQTINIFSDPSEGSVNHVYVYIDGEGWQYATPQSLTLTVVPEPATFLLFGTGIVFLRRKTF